MRPAFDLSVYLVTDPVLNGGRPVEDVVLQGVTGGATMVQLRDPRSDTRSLVETARRLAGLLRPRGIPFLVNDRIDVALAADADGVHVGQSDMDARDVRRLIGEDKILGLSVANAGEFETSRAALGVVDYLGVGPVFVTATKADAGAAIGPGGITAMRGTTSLPLVAIGGLDAARSEVTVRAGADGVAIVSAVMTAPDPAAAAATIAQAVSRGRAGRQ